MMRKKIQKEILLASLFLMLLSGSVFAFAVSSQYYDGNPLYLHPGESTEMFFTLQNLASEEDVRLQAEITDGANIIELTDASDIYDVRVGEKVKVNFMVTAPADAKKGDSFPVTIMFGTITSGEGPIGLSGNIGKGFNVVIGEPSDFDENGNLKTNISWIISLALAIVVIGTAVFYLRRNKKSPKK